MPRDGVSYDAVAAAAGQLRAEGERPSVRAVLGRLGSGSMTTIQKHLRAWRDQQKSQDAGISAIPGPLVSAITKAIANERADAVADLELQLEDALAASEELEGQIETLSADLAAEGVRRREVEDESVRLRAETESALERASRAEDRVHELSADVDRLRVELAKAEIRAQGERQAAEELREQRGGMTEALERAREGCVAAEQRAVVAEAGQQAADRALQDAERRHRAETERTEAVLVEERQRVVSLNERLERAREAASTETADLLRDLERARQEISELRVKLAAAPARANAAKRAKRGPKGDHGRPARLDR